MNYSRLIKENIKLLGMPVIINDGEDETKSYAVIFKNRSKNRLRFEDNSSEIGFYNRVYYEYIGPFDIDITALSDDAVLTCKNERYIFVQKDAVPAAGELRYYTGIMKKIGEDENAFE